LAGPDGGRTMQRLAAFWDHRKKMTMNKKQEIIAEFVLQLICSGGIAVFLGWAGLKFILEY
jgi:hypothetical protein